MWMIIVHLMEMEIGLVLFQTIMMAMVVVMQLKMMMMITMEY